METGPGSSGGGGSNNNVSMDWQSTLDTLSKRGDSLLKSGRWSDCSFLLGNPNHQQTIVAHKLILASASPVFEAMFYGELAEKNDPIPILDVQPDAFRSLLLYIYTDKFNITSVDQACELCYAAKKYMLPHVVEYCTTFLFKDLRPKNVCRAYEFAKLFEEPHLMKNCLDIMCTRTMEVLQDVSFEDVEIQTIIMILEENVLNIDSELSLFFALSRYVDKQCAELNATEEGNAQAPQEPVQNRALIREALKKIRFLTLTPQEFAEGPTNLLTQAESYAILMNISSRNTTVPMPDGFTTNRHTRALNQMELRAATPMLAEGIPMVGPLDMIDNLMGQRPHSPSNSSNAHGHHMRPSMSLVPLPKPNERPDDRCYNESRRYYAERSIRQQTDCLNTSLLDCSVTFTVDRSICIIGVHVPTQVLGESNMQRCNTDGNFPERYSELLYAHLLDSEGSRLTYTHCTSRVRFDSMLEVSFDRPVYIQKNKIYKMGVVFNRVGWYPMCVCLPTITCANVCFTFNVGSPNESVRDGLIRAIVFNFPRESYGAVQ